MLNRGGPGLILALACGAAAAQLVPGGIPGVPGGPLGGPAEQAPRSSSPRYDRPARPLQDWIDDEVLTDKREKKEWRRVDQKTPLPWIAPGQRVEAWEHVRHYDEYGDRKEIRWHVGARLAYPYYAYDYPISDAILRDPISLPWPHVGESMQRPDENYRRDLIVSPYRLQLVAIDPIVVVLLPYKDPPKPPHAWNKPRKTLSAADDAIDHADIRYATDFPARDGMMWFAPDAKIAARPLEFVDDRARIDAGNAHLDCERKNGIVRCTRVAE